MSKADMEPPAAHGGAQLNGRPGFMVRTRIARAADAESRYAAQAIRALPGPAKTGVFLQATDGKQAVSIYQQGRLPAPTLAPLSILPTRQLNHDLLVESHDDHWRSSEGRIAPLVKEHNFPPIADVMPEMDERPFALLPGQVKAGRGQRVVLGLDVEVLRRIVDAMGTSKLTLMIPLPVSQPNGRADELIVNQAVSVVPATSENDAAGLAVFMPLKPERATGYYRHMLQMLKAAETKAKRG